MELLIHISMVISFLWSVFALSASATGHFIYKFIVKLVSIIGVATVIIYYINYFNLLGTQV